MLPKLIFYVLRFTKKRDFNVYYSQFPSTDMVMNIQMLFFQYIVYTLYQERMGMQIDLGNIVMTVNAPKYHTDNVYCLTRMHNLEYRFTTSLFLKHLKTLPP